MNEVQIFLAHAIQLERESALRYKELAEAMQRQGNAEVADFFQQMAHFSRLHQKEAMDRAGFHDVPKMKPEEYTWADGASPEAVWLEVDPNIAVLDAMQQAMFGEQRSHEYYQAMADQTQNDEVRALASEFAEEEGEHVEQLEVWHSNLTKLSQ